MSITILNLINVFILASIVHYRYEKNLIPLHEEGVMTKHVTQIALILLNGFLTLTLAASMLFQFGAGPKTTGTVMILGTFLIIAGFYMIPRLALKTWTKPSLKKASIIKELLAMPLIILALEVSRTTLSMLYHNSFTDNLFVTILVIALVAGPICYFLFYFVIRASTTLTYPTKKWGLRYAIFLASIFININLAFLGNFIPGA